MNADIFEVVLIAGAILLIVIRIEHFISLRADIKRQKERAAALKLARRAR